MKYRKKPVVIEAEQWWPGKHVEGVLYRREWVKEDADGERIIREGPYIHTLEGDHEVTPGDFIITGVKGEKYPCKPDIFEATYDPVPAVEWDSSSPGNWATDNL